MVGTLFQGNRVHLSEVREFVWPNLDVLNNLEKEKFYDFTIKKKKQAVFKIQQMVTLAWLREKIFDSTWLWVQESWGKQPLSQITPFSKKGKPEATLSQLTDPEMKVLRYHSIRRNKDCLMKTLYQKTQTLFNWNISSIWFLCHAFEKNVWWPAFGWLTIGVGQPGIHRPVSPLCLLNLDPRLVPCSYPSTAEWAHLKW